MDLLVFLILMVVAYSFGTIGEKRHLRSLAEREAKLRPIPVITYDRHIFSEDVRSVQMVTGSVVIGADYFKTVLSGLINFFGGNISVLENVLSRGRREAVLRLKEKCQDADFLADLRYETADLGKRANSPPVVEVYTYATAIYLKK